MLHLQIQAFKIIKGIDRIDPEQLLSKPPSSANQRPFREITCSLQLNEARATIFQWKDMAWNSLPQEAINSKATLARLEFKIDLVQIGRFHCLRRRTPSILILAQVFLWPSSSAADVHRFAGLDWLSRSGAIWPTCGSIVIAQHLFLYPFNFRH